MTPSSPPPSGCCGCQPLPEKSTQWHPISAAASKEHAPAGVREGDGHCLGHARVWGQIPKHKGRKDSAHYQGLAEAWLDCWRCQTTFAETAWVIPSRLGAEPGWWQMDQTILLSVLYSFTAHKIKPTTKQPESNRLLMKSGPVREEEQPRPNNAGFLCNPTGLDQSRNNGKCEVMRPPACVSLTSLVHSRPLQRTQQDSHISVVALSVVLRRKE